MTHLYCSKACVESMSVCHLCAIPRFHPMYRSILTRRKKLDCSKSQMVTCRCYNHHHHSYTHRHILCVTSLLLDSVPMIFLYSVWFMRNRWLSFDVDFFQTLWKNHVYMMYVRWPRVVTMIVDNTTASADTIMTMVQNRFMVILAFSLSYRFTHRRLDVRDSRGH